MTNNISTQFLDIYFIILLAVVFVISSYATRRKVSNFYMLAFGILLCGISIGATKLLGRDVIELVNFEATQGLSRSYNLGLSMILGTVIIFILDSINHFLKKLKSYNHNC